MEMQKKKGKGAQTDGDAEKETKQKDCDDDVDMKHEKENQTAASGVPPRVVRACPNTICPEYRQPHWASKAHREKCKAVLPKGSARQGETCGCTLHYLCDYGHLKSVPCSGCIPSTDLFTQGRRSLCVIAVV